VYKVQDVAGKFGASGDQWQICKNDAVVAMGSFKEVLRICVYDLGFSPDGFERAVLDIVNNGHNTLEFNSKGKLIVTNYSAIISSRFKR
jgi:hypothetical protein